MQVQGNNEKKQRNDTKRGSKKIKSDNFTRRNREKNNIYYRNIGKINNLIMHQNHNLHFGST